MIDVSVCDGKYRVIMGDGKDPNFRALRYNEEWRDLCGDNFVYWLAVELQEAREKLNFVNKSIDLANKLCYDQNNRLTDGQICISLMKDIRGKLNE
jgi:hypothetical protein